MLARKKLASSLASGVYFLKITQAHYEFISHCSLGALKLARQQAANQLFPLDELKLKLKQATGGNSLTYVSKFASITCLLFQHICPHSPVGRWEEKQKVKLKQQRQAQQVRSQRQLPYFFTCLPYLLLSLLVHTEADNL